MSLSRKDMSTLLDNLVEQGASLKRIKKGWLILFPNGETTTVHLTESDRNSDKAIRARVKAAGLTWPFDKQEGRVDPRRRRTVEAVERALEQITERQFTLQQVSEIAGVGNSSVSSVLRAKGYRSKRTSDQRVVYYLPAEPVAPVPEEQREEPEYPEIERATAERAAEEQADEPEATEPEVGHTEEREFIDSVESWTVPVPRKLQKQADQMGLRIEVRVWRE